jgi:alkylation response protein AidB-like acyl-CoA dehydrogenase
MFLTEEHQLMRKLARQFAETELTADVLAAAEAKENISPELLRKMAEAGFLGIKVPKKYGGAGGDCRTYVVVMEEISRISPSVSLFVSGPNSLSGNPFLLAGTEEQLQKYLVPAVRGEKIIVFALTEPGAGSDAASLLTSAVADGDYYVLNGRKTFITMAPFADTAIIFAKTDASKGARGITAFIMDMNQPGVSRGKPEDKMGMRGCATGDIIMENVRIHKKDVLGEINQGFTNAMKALDVGRIGIAAQSIGVAQGALDEAVKYAKERKQFGKRIADFQAINFMLADMATQLRAAKLLTYEAAYLKDTKQHSVQAAAMAKLYAAEACNEICYKSLQIHGGYGYMKDYKIEQMYRDSRLFPIYEGTSQVQQMVIAAQLLKK